jgi:hypothetical protein
VTVPPQPADEATTGGTTASTILGNKRRRHKGSNIANTDSKGTTTTPQTGPVTTGVEPSSTCDADGDGVTDPGAPSTCSSGSTTTTPTDQTSPQPATVYSEPVKKKKPHATTRGKSKPTGKPTPKKRSKPKART